MDWEKDWGKYGMKIQRKLYYYYSPALPVLQELFAQLAQLENI